MLTLTDHRKAGAAERSLPPHHRPRHLVDQVPQPGREQLTVYTDGSVSTKRFARGLGALTGWGFIGTDGSYGCGRCPQFTPKAGDDFNVVAELRAVWYAAGARLADQPVTVVLDSQNAVRLLRQWKAGGDVMPAGYTGSSVREGTLHQLQQAVAGHPGNLTVEWTHGHAGTVLNEAADTLAQLGMRWARDNVPNQDVARRAAGIAEGFLTDWRRR